MTGPVRLGKLNLEGDRQADLRVHGGPERALLLYGAGQYPGWQAELGRPLAHGSFGENLTVEGFSEHEACLGDVYAVGDAVIQLSEVRGPCYKLQYRTQTPDMIRRVLESGHGGVYARVLAEGTLEAGDEVRLLERPHPDWAASRAQAVMNARSRNPAEAAELAGLEHLSANWRRRLEVSG